jgi:EmrB/QacA subfamily drug resistance transporter
VTVVDLWKPEPAAPTLRTWRAAVVVAGAAGFLISLDTTVNIAFPAITAAFELEVSEIQWVVISYVLTFASLLLAAGRLSDAFGHRRVLACGLVLTALGFVWCGLAPDFGWFLAGRVLQGGGAALVLGSAPALVTLLAPEHARSRALGGFQMGAALGLAIGPALGGALLEWSSWRSVFLFRLPVTCIVLALVVVLMPARADRVATDEGRGDTSLDLSGALLVGAGIAALLLALSRVRDVGWGAPLVVTGLVAAAVLLVIWVLVEQRSANPVIDLALLRDTPFVVANGLNVMANGTVFAVWLLTPYYLLNVRGLSTIAGGAVLGVAPLATALAAPLAGRLDGRISTGRLCSIGLGLEAVGLAAVAATGAATPMIGVCAALALAGFGLGLFTVPNLSYVMGSISQDRQGVAGGLSQMMRMVGVVAGVAGASLFFDARVQEHVAERAVAADDPGAFVAAYRDTFLLVAFLCALAAAVSLLRPPRSARGRLDRSSDVAVERSDRRVY